MRRSITLLTVVLSMMAMMALPAAAHVLVVDSPGGDGDPKVGWVGGGELPEAAEGNGLIPGGPTGAYLQSPSHDGGLVTACERLRAHGNGVVDIFGPNAPGEPPTCRHGGR